MSETDTQSVDRRTRLRRLVSPNWRDVIILLLGVMVGVGLGPMVLGNVSPDLYARLFRGDAALTQDLDALRAEYDDLGQRTRESGASLAAVQDVQLEFETQAAEIRQRIEAQRGERRTWLASRMQGLIVAIVVLMLLAAVVGPTRPLVQARFITVCYILLAGWLVGAFALPDVLPALPWAFIALLLLVAIVGALVPIGRRGDADAD